MEKFYDHKYISIMIGDKISTNVPGNAVIFQQEIQKWVLKEKFKNFKIDEIKIRRMLFSKIPLLVKKFQTNAIKIYIKF